jgi:hypothetical protein
MKTAPETTPLLKHRNLWVLALVTYGLVIITGFLAVIAYRRIYPEAGAAEVDRELKYATVMVGLVWMPVFPGGIVQDSTSTTTGGFVEGSMKFTSTDRPSKVLTFYHARLTKVGYRLKFSGDIIEATSRDGKSSVTVALARTTDGSDVQIRTRRAER